MGEFKSLIWQDYASQYREVRPSLALRPYIDCYWMSLSERDGQGERVIPDLCADFILTFTPAFGFKELRYSGPNTRYFMAVSDDEEITLGIRFYLGTLRKWLPVNLAQTKDSLLGEWDGLAAFSAFLTEALKGQPSAEQLLASFDHFFLRQLADSQETASGSLIQNVIRSSLELVDYRQIIQREVLSERTIQRIFRQETGLSPYEVYDILRFQKTLYQLKVAPASDLVALALSQGYYDQAHLNRRFKTISGLTPTEIRQTCRHYPRQAGKS